VDLVVDGGLSTFFLFGLLPGPTGGGICQYFLPNLFAAGRTISLEGRGSSYLNDWATAAHLSRDVDPL